MCLTAPSFVFVALQHARVKKLFVNGRRVGSVGKGFVERNATNTDYERVCAGDRGGDSTGGSGERTGGRSDSGVHDDGEMVLWVIEVLVVEVALVMVSIVSGTFVVLVDVLA